MNDRKPVTTREGGSHVIDPPPADLPAAPEDETEDGTDADEA